MPAPSTRERPLATYFLQTAGPAVPDGAPTSRQVFGDAASRRRSRPRTAPSAADPAARGCSEQPTIDARVKKAERPTSAFHARKVYAKSKARTLRLQRRKSSVIDSERLREELMQRPDIDCSDTEDLRAQMRSMLLELRSQNVQSTKLAPQHHKLVVKRKDKRQQKACKTDHGSGGDQTSGRQPEPAPIVLHNEALQSQYLERPAPSKVLSETTAEAGAKQTGAAGIGPEGGSAVDQVEARVAVMHSSYNAISAEVNEWKEKVRIAKAKREEVAHLIAKETEARRALEDRARVLDSELAAIVRENSKLTGYLPRMHFLVSRGHDAQKARKDLIAARVEAIRVLEEGGEEALSLCKSTKRESAAVVQQRDALEASLTATERKYFEALAERRDEIAKVDALTGYFASSIQTLFARKNENGSKSPAGARGILGGRHMLADDAADPQEGPSEGFHVKSRHSLHVKSRLANQEMANIASIITHKGQHAKEVQQQLGSAKYGPREIQTIFKSIEERSGVKIITPQEMLDWAHTNREVEENIRKEEDLVLEKVQALAATKQALTEKLALIDQRTGATNARLKHSAYEDLHREILTAKHRKQEARLRIRERQSMLAAFAVCIQGLRDKLGAVSLAEDWVHKLSSSLHANATAPAKLQRKNRNSSSNMVESTVAGSLQNPCASSTTQAVMCMVSVQDKLAQISHICELAAEVGLFAGGGSGGPVGAVPITDRQRLDLNCIEDPQPQTNVRVRAGAEGPVNDDDLLATISQSMKRRAAHLRDKSTSKRSMASTTATSVVTSGRDENAKSAAERRMCALLANVDEDDEFATLRAQMKANFRTNGIQEGPEEEVTGAHDAEG